MVKIAGSLNILQSGEERFSVRFAARGFRGGEITLRGLDRFHEVLGALGLTPQERTQALNDLSPPTRRADFIDMQLDEAALRRYGLI